MKRIFYALLISLFTFTCFAQKTPKIDSLAVGVTALNQEVSELKRDNSDLRKDLGRANERLDDYNDMFKQQWTAFSNMLVLISLFFAVGIPLLAYLSLRNFMNSLNERFDSMEDRYNVAVNEVGDIKVDLTKLGVELSEKIKDIYLKKRIDHMSGAKNFGIHWITLEEFINQYRLTKDIKYDSIIQHAASVLMDNIKSEDGSFKVSDELVMGVIAYVKFEFLRDTTDLPRESQFTLIRLHESLREYLKYSFKDAHELS